MIVVELTAMTLVRDALWCFEGSEAVGKSEGTALGELEQ
jgi:hypothetical protein